MPWRKPNINFSIILILMLAGQHKAENVRDLPEETYVLGTRAAGWGYYICADT